MTQTLVDLSRMGGIEIDKDTGTLARSAIHKPARRTSATESGDIGREVGAIKRDHIGGGDSRLIGKCRTDLLVELSRTDRDHIGSF